MSNGLAKQPKTIADDIIQLKRDRKKAFGLERRNASGISSVVATSGANRGGSDNKPVDSGNLKTAGGTMIGPIAFYPVALTVSSGAIDISQATGTGFTSRVILSGEGAAADDLVTITGAHHAGQMLIIQSVATTPITLKHGTGNIWSPTLGDYVITDKENVILVYDSINTVWSCVANFVASGGGGGGMNTDLSNMTGPTAPTVDLNMNNNDIIGVANIDLDGATATVEGVRNLNFYSGHSINDLTDLLYQSNSTNAHRFLVSGTSRFDITNSAVEVRQSVDMNNNTIVAVNKIEFNNNSDDYIDSTASGIVYNVNSTDEHFFNVNGVNKVTIDSTHIDFNDDIKMNNNDIDEVSVLRFNTAGQNFTTSASEILYQVPSGDVHGFYVAATKTLEITDTYLEMQSGKYIDFGANISLTASAGFQTLPANPVGFIIARVNGGLARIPYYNT